MEKVAMLTITKEFLFDAAHRLRREELSDAENTEIFGKCSKIHGHTYRLRITVAGGIDKNGMIIHFSDLKALVKQNVVDRYDHAMLNDLEEYRTLPPTAEVMGSHIFTTLGRELARRDLTLTAVTLFETPTSWATVTADA